MMLSQCHHRKWHKVQSNTIDSDFDGMMCDVNWMMVKRYIIVLYIFSVCSLMAWAKNGFSNAIGIFCSPAALQPAQPASISKHTYIFILKYLDGLSQCFIYPAKQKHSHTSSGLNGFESIVFDIHYRQKKERRRRLNDSFFVVAAVQNGIKWMCPFWKLRTTAWELQTRDMRKTKTKLSESRKIKCRKEIINRRRQLNHRKHHNMTWL